MHDSMVTVVEFLSSAVEIQYLTPKNREFGGITVHTGVGSEPRQDELFSEKASRAELFAFKTEQN